MWGLASPLSRRLTFQPTALYPPLLPDFLPVSTPNFIHHSRLTVCLLDSEFDPLPIDFFGQAPVNKLVSVTLLLTSRVYDYQYSSGHQPVAREPRAALEELCGRASELSHKKNF